MKREKISITLKGRAVVAAVDAGLLPETDDGWDDTGFLRFWELFEPDLRKEIEKEVNHAVTMLYQQRNHSSGDCTKNRIKNLKFSVRFLFGFLFGFFLAHFVLGPLIFG